MHSGCYCRRRPLAHGCHSELSSKDVDGPLMHDDTMAFCNWPKAAFLARLRFGGRMSFECLHHTLRTLTQDIGRTDFKLSNRLRSLFLKGFTLLRSVDKELRYR